MEPKLRMEEEEEEEEEDIVNASYRTMRKYEKLE